MTAAADDPFAVNRPLPDKNGYSAQLLEPVQIR